MPAGSFAGTGEPVGDGIPPTFANLLDRLSATAAVAAAAEGTWLERLAAGLSALLAFLDQNPQRAVLLADERPLDGLLLTEATGRVHVALAEVLDAGRGEVVVGGELTPPSGLIAELLVMAVLSLVRTRLLRQPRAPLADLVPSLMRFVVEPYVGAGAANADLARSQPGVRRPSQAEVVPIRPHPRVIRALKVISSTPGLSSHDIELAEYGEHRAGKRISEVLKRLEQRGVIESARRARNHPNAWLLTPYGRRVLELNSQRSDAPLTGGARDAAQTRPSRRLRTRPAPSGLALAAGWQR